jgi:hypothetical protein
VTNDVSQRSSVSLRATSVVASLSELPRRIWSRRRGHLRLLAHSPYAEAIVSVRSRAALSDSATALLPIAAAML